MPFINGKKFSGQDNGKYADLIALPAFKKGVVNRLNEYSLPEGGLVQAINVDIDNSGKLKRRKNYSKKISGKVSSLWNDSKGKGYMLLNGSLNTIDASGKTTVVDNGIPSNSKLSYLELNSEIYYSNGSNYTGKINQYGSHDIWSIDSPQTPPSVSLGTSGSLKAGRYIVAYTYLRGSYETGVSPYSVVEVSEGNDGKGSISVHTSGSSNSTGCNIYITPVNSENLGLHTTSVSASITDTNYLGRVIKKETATGFPALENLSYMNGRIIGSKDNYIFWTLPYDYRQFDPSRNGLGLDSKIVLMTALDQGLWVVTETSTYWLQTTDFEQDSTQLSTVLPYSAIKGTLFKDEDKRLVGWLSTAGYIVADSTGKAQNLTEETMDFAKNYSSGAALFRKDKGIKQVIFSLREEGIKTGFQTEV